MIPVAVYVEESAFKLVLVEQKFKESFYEKDQFLGIPVAPTVDMVQASARSMYTLNTMSLWIKVSIKCINVSVWLLVTEASFY